MSSYSSYSGKMFIMGKKIGSGGEGTVYAVQGDNSIVAKLYNSTKFRSTGERQTMDQKLKTMIKMNIPNCVDGIIHLAWPLDILYDNGTLIGFIMPNIKADCKIYDVQRADPCRIKPAGKDMFSKAYPDYTWKHQVQFAYNLAWLVNYLHSHNVVIGDLNQSNIYADTKIGAVVLVDCDSFDIKDPKTGKHFPCVVGLPELLAPELQVVHDLSQGTFTKETDNFSLAIQIFRLLMRNEDPFGGVMTIQRSSSAVSPDAAIINGECAYVRYVEGKSVPKRSPTLDMLPKDIQVLFKRTFSYDALTAMKRKGDRATAAEWCNALLKLAKGEPNGNLQKCSQDSRHVYPASSTYCPWCRIQQAKQQRTTTQQQITQQTVQQQTTTQQQTTQQTVQQQTTTQQQTTQQTAQQQTTTQQTVQQNTYGIQPSRKPYLLYIVWIAAGLASGFVFGEVVSQVVGAVFGIYPMVVACRAFLSVVGVISGALIANHFSYDYVHSFNIVPWLLLGIVGLLVPLVIAAAFGLVLFVVTYIMFLL